MDNRSMEKKCSRCEVNLGAWGWKWFQITTKNGPEVVCQKCYRNLLAGAYNDVSDPSPRVSSSKEDKVPSQMNLEDLVAAQDRTTHAVRSLAITFVAAPIISLAVIATIFMAINSGNTGLIVFVGITGLLILIGTLIKSIEELTLSKK
jgi:hypothetical protein